MFLVCAYFILNAHNLGVSELVQLLPELLNLLNPVLVSLVRDFLLSFALEKHDALKLLCAEFATHRHICFSALHLRFGALKGLV